MEGFDGSEVIGAQIPSGWLISNSDNLIGEMPNGLISLRAMMEKYKARGWLSIGGYLSHMEYLSGEKGPNEEDLEILGYVKSECQTLGLTLSVLSADRMVTQLQATLPPTNTEFSRMVAELRRRILDETSSVLFLQVPARDAPFYEGQQLFGEEVEACFPSVSLEISEAGKCLALGRNTACVFHLMRVIEVGLRTLASALRIRMKRSQPTWNDLIVAVQNRIKPTQPKRNLWQKHEVFVAGVATYMGDISRAWRNPLVHKVSVFYSEEDARDIFQSVGAFMCHLATKLDERKRKIL
jgi:hypothetical protein